MKINKNNNSSILLRKNQFQVSLIAMFLSNLIISQSAAEEEALCAFQPSSIINAKIFSPDGKTHLQSDSVEINEKDISRFNGNVVIQQKDKRIETELAEYTKTTEQIDAKGKIRFVTPNIQVKSEVAHFNLKTDQALLQQSQYQSLTSRARGKASSIEISTPNITELSNATYTTCDPENSDWLLSANSIKLDNNTQQGHAKHVVVRFKDVPFFYFPYLRFPLGEKRLSGFLFPYIGSSNEDGNEIKIPYYWNIHPQIDATITPWYMSKRGLLLHSEFRYLTEQSHGTLTAEYLDDDKVFNANRERLHWKHQSQSSSGWQTNAEYNYAADNSHLIDFNDDLNISSTTYLVRTGSLAYNATNWLMNIKAEDHQILSGANSYKRLPQVTLASRYAIRDNEINYALQSEVVRFDHDDNKVIGDRLHLKPSIYYPLRTAAGFIEPKISAQYSSYNLKQTSGEKHLSRTVPTFSLNSGLFFERDSQFFDVDYIQTLEPQLFYVYVPYKDQSALPVFDTSAYSFNVNQSFTDYRFNGVDRVGDDNRLTAALATRFIDQSNGQEKFMARVGQIYYFADRKVQLPSVAVDSHSQSHLIAELKTHFQAYGQWGLSSQTEWDPKLDESVISSNQLYYNYNKFNFDFAHRYQRNTLETREIKVNWQISPSWQLLTNNLYDLRSEHIIENLLGINYESCCWGLQLSAKERYITSTQTDRGIYLKLILKGLGGFGIQQ